MSDTTQPLWSEKDIRELVESYAKPHWEGTLRKYILERRNQYEARLAETERERNALRQELKQLRANGHTPLRDTVGGVINAEWQPVNPVSMANDEYADAEIMLCYRRVIAAGEE